MDLAVSKSMKSYWICPDFEKKGKWTVLSLNSEKWFVNLFFQQSLKYTFYHYLYIFLAFPCIRVAIIFDLSVIVQNTVAFFTQRSKNWIFFWMILRVLFKNWCWISFHTMVEIKKKKWKGQWKTFLMNRFVKFN